MPSSIPDAIDALVAVVTAAVTDADVCDGPPVKSLPGKWVAVGYVPGDDPTSVDNWTQEARGLGQQGREERYDVRCSLGDRSGGLRMQPVRASAFAMLAAIETALRANPDLTETVRFAEMSGGAFLQDRPEDERGRGFGLAAGIEFRITCQARI